MRRSIVFLGVLALLLTSVLAVPAGADRPTPQEPFTNTFPSENPCTGEGHLVTLNFSTVVHEHRNSLSAHTRRSGTTSDGFVMQNGREIQRINFISTMASSTFMDIWVNPETGQRFKVSGVFVASFPDGPFAPPESVNVDRFTLRCVH